MMRRKAGVGLVVAAGLAVMPVLGQEAAKKEPPKPAPSSSQGVLEQWNDIGRKLIIMAEDFPDEKYEYKPHSDSRTFAANLIHVSASMYYFTDTAQGQKPRYPDDPKRDDLRLQTKMQVIAFVKQCVEDGPAVIKAKDDKRLNEIVTDGAQHAAALRARRSSGLGSGGAGDAVFEDGDELLRVADGWKASVAGADDGERLSGGEMRKSFLEGTGEMELRSFGSNAQDGFAEA